MKEDIPGSLWSGLVICINSRSPYLTAGRIYEVKDGALRFDNGVLSYVTGEEIDFDGFCNTFDSDFLEYRGERLV